MRQVNCTVQLFSAEVARGQKETFFIIVDAPIIELLAML